jgi:hypothetical protein
MFVLPKVKLSVADATGQFVRERSICVPKSPAAGVVASLRVDLTCPGDAQIRQSLVTVSGVTVYSRLDEEIRSATPDAPGTLGYLKRFSTVSLPTEPWAVLGLPSLVEQVARGARQNTKTDALASIAIERNVTQ